MNQKYQASTPLKEISANIRINAILKEDQSFKISIVAATNTSISKIKRIIQQEFSQLHNLNILVSTIQDFEGFILSNNSNVGEHLRNNQNVYVMSHRDKQGSDMNLPHNISDLFITLRYVSKSVLKKIQKLTIELSPEQVIPEIMHLAFWHTNPETVLITFKILNKATTTQSLERSSKNQYDLQNTRIIKLFQFWFCDYLNLLFNNGNLNELGMQLLCILFKVSLSKYHASLIKNQKFLKNIVQLSKDQQLSSQQKRMIQQTIKNVSNNKTNTLFLGNTNNLQTQSGYLPQTFNESAFQYVNLEQILENLSSNDEQSKKSALSALLQNPKAISEVCVRFDYYLKAVSNIFSIRSIKDKTSSKIFNGVMKQIIQNTSSEKAQQIIQKNIIKKIHNFLLQSHLDVHPSVFQYFTLISTQSASKGIYPIVEANQLILSPYLPFQKANINALSILSLKDKQISSIIFLPYIRDYIKLSLKTQHQDISTNLIKIISNLTLDEQCRYQIINLKGVELLVKFMEIGDKSKNAELQRVCGKGLLNLSVYNREVKSKILSLLVNILQRYYKGYIDSIASGYLQNILKTNKN